MISIIMPAWNREAYLADTIESIIGQSYKDFELIIVDDGSTDDSKFLYDYYTKKDKRIKVLYVEHGGISKARNEGISVSQGEYICVMDSDDLMVKDRLKVSLKAIDGYDFVYSPYAIHRGGEIQVVDTPKKITFEDVKKNGAWPHVTIMAKRECFIENPYRDDFIVNDDAWLVWKWFQAGYKAKRITKPMVLVKIHESNITKRRPEIERTQKIMDAAYEASGNN
jgi:glycosyltransferase involved in cell wall biosynthesis